MWTRRQRQMCIRDSTFTAVGEAEGSFLEQEIKGGKFKTKKQR